MSWRKGFGAVAAVSLLALWILPASAGASFGFAPGAEGFSVSLAGEEGPPETLAGSHPYEVHLHVALNEAGQLSDGDLRDLRFGLPPGLLVTPTVDACTLSAFSTPRNSPFQESLSGESCPNASQVGTVAVHSSFDGGSTRYFGVFNLAPPPGSPEAIGFSPFGVPITGTFQVRPADGDLSLHLNGISQAKNIQGLDIVLWGTPWATPTSDGRWTFWHDNERGNCLNEVNPEEPFGKPAPPEGQGKPDDHINGTCSIERDPDTYNPPAYVSLPTRCGQQMRWEASATSWDGAEANASFATDDGEGHPVSPADCTESRSVAEVQLFTERAAAATGMRFGLVMQEPGLIARSRLSSPTEAATMSLPEGLTINPSLAAGLNICSQEQFAREDVSTSPGTGCPDDSRIGSASVEGLLGLSLPPLKGAVYLAEPYRNPSGSLIALYLVLRDPARGLFFKSTGSVEPDPRNGRLRVTFKDLPEIYYSRFDLRLREGQRSTLVSPSSCGTYIGELELTPYSDPSVGLHNLSYLHITAGEDGGPCPGGAARPFTPGLEAGSLNAAAGAYSPFYLHMTRADAEQEITSYSATFPPGLLGKIAGIPFCPDAAIEAAKARTGIEELEQPSCPAASSVGHTLAGYGVGGTLAYAPGGLYLTGPYHGSPLSITAIDSAIVGPFDLGVVVVRSAIRVDPITARVAIDSSGSDPIPHMLKGIPLHLSDIRVFIDRHDFTVNPTSCDELQSLSTLTGAGFDTSTSADDPTAVSSDRYQLLGCPELGFKPGFRLRLRGRLRRGGFPSLTATYVPRAGNANIKSAVVALPHTEFLAQGHIREICSGRQWAAAACPRDSIYGKARAVTPLLDEPLEGAVYLRSSSHPLPDMVVDLHGRGGLHFELVGRVDSTKAGGMRASFETLPDAPVTKFVLTLAGGRRGLLENSANICAARSFASVRFAGHNNQTDARATRIEGDCKQRRKRHKKVGK